MGDGMDYPSSWDAQPDGWTDEQKRSRGWKGPMQEIEVDDTPENILNDVFATGAVLSALFTNRNNPRPVYDENDVATNQIRVRFPMLKSEYLVTVQRIVEPTLPRHDPGHD